MSGTTGYPSSQFKLVSGFFNSENNPAIGVPLASPSGSIVEQYGGFLGLEVRLSEDDAANMTAPSAAVTRPSAINPPGTTAAATKLLGGIYKMVRFSSAMTAANCVVGRLVFWDLSVAADLYQVYQPLTGDNQGTPLIAGVIVNPTAAQAVGNASAGPVTPGNYGIIQIAGRCIVQVSATSGDLPTTKSTWMIWSRSAVSGNLGSVTYAPAAENFGTSVVGTPPNQTTIDFSDVVGVVEDGNASAPTLPGVSTYVIVNVPYGRFALRQ